MPGFSLKLSWAPNLEVDIDKYCIYSVSSTGVKAIYQYIIHPNVTANIPVSFPDGVASGSFSFCISAIDKVGNESAQSPTVTYEWTYDIVPPNAPTGLTIVRA